MTGTMLYRLAEADAALRRAFDQYLGMSRPRYTLIALLMQGELSHAALQRQLHQDNAVVTRIVKQFEAEGLVRRRVDPTDNRFTLASLTPEGRRFGAHIKAAHRDFIGEILAGISVEDQAQASAVLERLTANLLDRAARTPTKAKEDPDDSR